MTRWLFKSRRPISLFFIVCILHGNSSCYYYTYRSDLNPTMEKLDYLRSSPDYLILHQNKSAWNMHNVTINKDAQTMTGTLRELPTDHQKYETTKPYPGSTNRYIKSHKKFGATPQVINEVHIYTKDLQALATGSEVVIPLSAISKIDVYDPDTGATTASWVLGSLGFGGGGLGLLVMVIVLLTSCPFLYIDNGNEYVFAGEIFGGAIFQSIERDDYLLLPQLKTEGEIKMFIANKLKEQQFINKIELMQIGHAPGVKALADRYGKVHAVSRPQMPLSAKANGFDISGEMKKLDSTYFAFDRTEGKDYFNEVVLTFPKPAGSSEGHLVLNGKNSLWGDYVFGEFTNLFGAQYMPWVEKQNKKTDDPNWALDQGLAMKAFVEVNGEWKYIDQVDLVGPLASRDIVVPIDLAGHSGNEVKVKLTAGFMMWELDFAGLDFSQDNGLDVKYYSPSSAITHDGKDARPSLSETDTNYLAQPNVGDDVSIVFSVEQKPGLEYNYVFHSRGYYNHVREYEGLPDISELVSFRKEGRFSNFSKEKFDELNEVMKVAELSARAPEVSSNSN